MPSTALSQTQREDRVHRQKKAILAMLEQFPAEQHVSLLHRLRDSAIKRMAQNTERHDEAAHARYNEAVTTRILLDEKGRYQHDRKSRQKNLWILFFLCAAASLAHQYFLPPANVPAERPPEAIILLAVGTAGFILTAVLTVTEMRTRRKERQEVMAELTRSEPSPPDIMLEAVDAILASQYR
ncbi:MAG: hypothetical protein AWU57_536 [Marinobacter sp. T13-3]|nr:MAG: hypothetical protein AWU57_536 [Marinobacter sp. T13-3]